MANERLVSNVYYEGTKIGASEFMVEDTSRYPTYDFNMSDAIVGGVANPNQLNQLGAYDIEMQSNSGKIAGVDNVYVRMTCSDGKLLALGAFIDGTAITVRESTLPIDGNGNFLFNFPVNFFPSLTGFSGKVEFFHDAGRALLIRSVPLSVVGLTSASITIANTTGANNTIYFGDSFVTTVTAVGQIGMLRTSSRSTSIYGMVGTFRINASNTWLVNGNANIGIGWTNVNTGSVQGQVINQVVNDPRNGGEPLISVRMGDLVASTRILSLPDGIVEIVKNAHVEGRFNGGSFSGAKFRVYDYTPKMLPRMPLHVILEYSPVAWNRMGGVVAKPSDYAGTNDITTVFTNPGKYVNNTAPSVGDWIANTYDSPAVILANIRRGTATTTQRQIFGDNGEYVSPTAGYGFGCKVYPGSYLYTWLTSGTTITNSQWEENTHSSPKIRITYVWERNSVVQTLQLLNIFDDAA